MTGLVVCDCVWRIEEVRTPGVGGADFRIAPAESGDGGRLAIREEAVFWGCGMAIALVVRRTVLPAELTPRGLGNEPVGAAVSSGGRLDDFLGSCMRDLGVLDPEGVPTRDVVDELAVGRSEAADDIRVKRGSRN